MRFILYEYFGSPRGLGLTFAVTLSGTCIIPYISDVCYTLPLCARNVHLWAGAGADFLGAGNTEGVQRHPNHEGTALHYKPNVMGRRWCLNMSAFLDEREGTWSVDFVRSLRVMTVQARLALCTTLLRTTSHSPPDEQSMHERENVLR